MKLRHTIAIILIKGLPSLGMISLLWELAKTDIPFLAQLAISLILGFVTGLITTTLESIYRKIIEDVQRKRHYK